MGGHRGRERKGDLSLNRSYRVEVSQESVSRTLRFRRKKGSKRELEVRENCRSSFEITNYTSFQVSMTAQVHVQVDLNGLGFWGVEEGVGRGSQPE